MFDSKLDPLWASWFTGFMDGEGYFQIARETATYYRVKLTIDMREDDELIVREIQHTLGVGQVYHISKKADRAKGRKSVDQFRWTCTRVHEVVDVLIPLFDAFPLKTKKARDYKIWREAAFFIYAGGHLLDLERLHKESLQQRKYWSQ